MPLAVCSLLAALYAVRLVVPWGEVQPATPVGAYLAAGLGARIVLLGLAAALLVRLWESLGAAFDLSRRETAHEEPAPAAQAPESQEQDLAFVVRIGLLLGSAGLGVALLLMPGRTLAATLTQLGMMAATWLREGAVVTSGVGRLTAEWTGYAAAVGAIVIVLIAVHDEAMRGRVAVYPLLALVWSLLLGILALGWGLQVSATSLLSTPGRVPALAVTGLVLLLLAAATATVWVRWLRLRRQQRDLGEDMLDRSDPIGAAHSLGSVGLVLVLAAAAAVVLAALSSSAETRPTVTRLSQAAAGLQDWLALSVETARTQLTVYDWLGPVVGLLAAASLAVLCLHLASQRRAGWARLVLFALWSGGALAGAGVSVYLLLQVAPGQWSGARVATAIVLAALFVRALIALGGLGRWAGLRAAGQAEEVHSVH